LKKVGLPKSHFGHVNRLYYTRVRTYFYSSHRHNLFTCPKRSGYFGGMAFCSQSERKAFLIASIGWKKAGVPEKPFFRHVIWLTVHLNSFRFKYRLVLET